MDLEFSIPVPSVEELSKQGLQTLPSRYVRDDINTIVAPLHLRVPVIDFDRLLSPDHHRSELSKLHIACKDWGIFQLINHGVSAKSIDQIKKTAKDFFDLPLEEKKQCSQKPGSLEGYGQAFVVSDDQKLEWSDMIFLKILPFHDQNLSQWPHNPPTFKNDLELYTINLNKLTVSLLEFIAMGLGLSKTTEFSNAFKDGHYQIRMNYIPPCPQPEKAIGIDKHCDISGLTFLLECGDVPALQVFKDDQWVFVHPIEDSLVVNLGQAMEIMSNGVYKAAEHRAVVNGLHERISIVTFCYPDSVTEICPAKEVLTERENLALFRSVKFDEYVNTFFRRNIDTPFLDCFKL